MKTNLSIVRCFFFETLKVSKEETKNGENKANYFYHFNECKNKVFDDLSANKIEVVNVLEEYIKKRKIGDEQYVGLIKLDLAKPDLKILNKYVNKEFLIIPEFKQIFDVENIGFKEDLYRHMIIFGETGSGKTYSVLKPIINSLVDYRGKCAVLFIDPKQQELKKTYVGFYQNKIEELYVAYHKDELKDLYNKFFKNKSAAVFDDFYNKYLQGICRNSVKKLEYKKNEMENDFDDLYERDLKKLYAEKYENMSALDNLYKSKNDELANKLESAENNRNRKLESKKVEFYKKYNSENELKCEDEKLTSPFESSEDNILYDELSKYEQSIDKAFDKQKKEISEAFHKVKFEYENQLKNIENEFYKKLLFLDKKLKKTKRKEWKNKLVDFYKDELNNLYEKFKEISPNEPEQLKENFFDRLPKFLDFDMQLKKPVDIISVLDKAEIELKGEKIRTKKIYLFEGLEEIPLEDKLELLFKLSPDFGKIIKLTLENSYWVLSAKNIIKSLFYLDAKLLEKGKDIISFFKEDILSKIINLSERPALIIDRNSGYMKRIKSVYYCLADIHRICMPNICKGGNPPDTLTNEGKEILKIIKEYYDIPSFLQDTTHMFVQIIGCGAPFFDDWSDELMERYVEVNPNFKKDNFEPWILSIKGLMEKENKVFFCIPSKKLKSYDRIGKILKFKWFQFSIDDIMFEEREKDKIKVFYIADEFHRFITGDEESGEQSFLDRCRAYNVSCILATQSIPSLRYGISENTDIKSENSLNDSLQIILNNCGTKLYFRTTDSETHEHLLKITPRSPHPALNFIAGEHVLNYIPLSALMLGECYYYSPRGKWGKTKINVSFDEFL